MMSFLPAPISSMIGEAIVQICNDKSWTVLELFASDEFQEFWRGLRELGLIEIIESSSRSENEASPEQETAQQIIEENYA